MKNSKQIFVLAALLILATAIQAQNGKTADQAKLPSNRPIPDKRIMERKIEEMRAIAYKSQLQHQQAIRQMNQQQPVIRPDDRKPVPIIKNK